MAEAIGFSVVANLITKLVAPALRDVWLTCNVEDDLMKLKETLSTINAVLLDADQRKEKSHLMQDWIVRLNDVVYDADDLLDAIATKALQCDGHITKVREMFSSPSQAAFSLKIVSKIKAIERKLDNIATNMSKYFNFTTSLMVEPRGYTNHRETDSFILESEIIGREEDREEVIKLIMSETISGENVSVIHIVGIGGLGKTTLAQLVYNAPSVYKHFILKSWVCVSEDFNTKSLVKKILKSIATIHGVDNLELEQLQRHLREKLNKNRYLLVLDDVWSDDPDEWESIRKFLMGGLKGSKIVVTTRSERVASVMEIGSTSCVYTLKGLNDDQSWILFEKIAFRGQNKAQLNLIKIGKEIIKRCHGVPLGIRSLASVMQTKTRESEWIYIQNSDIWSSSKNNDIIPILKLSYDHLPMHLRQCFEYCSVFPKGHEIKKEMLIQLWMAQGYVESSNESQYLEDVGNQYFMDLLLKLFFQDIVLDDFNEVISCKMHDLIHDLARSVGSSCCILKTNKDSISERVRHMSVLRLEGLITQSFRVKGLRTLLSLNRNDISNLGVSSFTCLRVLDIHNCGVGKVPDSICKLLHLRYLDLSQNIMKSLPSSIGDLINLQTLNVSYCPRLNTLPTSIAKLISLRCLLFDGSGTFQLPTGVKNLTSLRKLSYINLQKDKEGFQLSDLNGLNELRGELILNYLGEVKDAELESKAANLIGKQYLQSLRLSWFSWRHLRGTSLADHVELLEGLQPHKELRVLEIRGHEGIKFPSWMMEGNILLSLPNIVRITLDHCSHCKRLPSSLHQLHSLKFLMLERLDEVVHIDYDEDNLSLSSPPLFFPALEELQIEECRNLQGWWTPTSSSQQHPSFPLLKKLEITSCHKLMSLPIAPHLEELKLDGVHLELLHLLLSTATMITTGGFAISPSKLKVLKLASIQDLNYLPKDIQHLITLQYFSIINCPLWMLPEGLRNIKSLRSLQIDDCSELRVRCHAETGADWYKISHIPNIVID